MADETQPQTPPVDPQQQEAFNYGTYTARGFLGNVKDHGMHSNPVAHNVSIAAGFLVFATVQKVSLSPESPEPEINRAVVLVRAFVDGFMAIYDRAHPQQDDESGSQYPIPPPKDDGMPPMYG